MAAVSFAELSRKGAKRFIQTVLVIDNELKLEPEQQEGAPGVVNNPAASARDTAKEQPSNKERKTNATVSPDKSTSALDAKKIMDAFLKQSMICGMHKPSTGDELVAESILAAKRSDALILDWRLEKANTTPAKDIIAGILEGDAAEHGRLRLIAIYTDEPDVAGIQAEVLDRLKGQTFANPSVGVLFNSDARIVVLNKEKTPGAVAPVKIGDLPSRIIDEFAQLTGGVLSTFAVTAIASVRRAVHHVLAIFSKDLDGAFLGHVCALKTPDDAVEFALDLLAGELRSVASMNSETTQVLSPESLGLYIDSRAEGGILKKGAISVPVSVAREFPLKGANFVNKSIEKQKTQGNDGKTTQPSKANAVSQANVGYLFHGDEASAEAAHRRFARFSSFKTEMFDRTTLPKAWAPTLMLGSLIVGIDAAVKPEERQFLVCTQPRCDAVRLPSSETERKIRTFPFQTAVIAADPHFNLVAAVPGAAGGPETVLLKVGMKPHETRMVDFTPAEGQDRILGVKDASGLFVFTDVQGRRYAWIGDLRDLVAQRAASAVASRMHQVGLDEYEWLRQKAELMIKAAKD